MENLDADILQEYWLAITAIEAQEALVHMQVADYPHLKKDNRRQAHRRMHSLAHPDFEESSENVGSVEDAVSFLRQHLGVG